MATADTLSDQAAKEGRAVAIIAFLTFSWFEPPHSLQSRGQRAVLLGQRWLRALN